MGEHLGVNRAWCVCSPISVTQSVCMTISILLWCLLSSFLVLHNLIFYHTTSCSLAASCGIHWFGSHFSEKLRQLQLRRGSICERSKYSLRAPHSNFTPKSIKSAAGWPMKVKLLVTQSCLTLCNPMYCSPPGSSVHGTLQTRILECVTIPFSRGSSQPRDWTWVSCMAGGSFTVWASREALKIYTMSLIVKKISDKP